MTRTARNTFVRLAAAATLAALAGSAHAQIFQRLSGTPRDELPYDSEQTHDSGWITVGERTGFVNADGTIDPADFLITKYAPDGSVMWVTQYGGPGRDVAYSVHQTHDGGYIVAGQTDSMGPTLGLALLRLDPLGTPIWANVYPADVFGEIVNPALDKIPAQVAVRESRLTEDIIVVANIRGADAAAGGQHGIFLRTTAAGFPIIHRTYFDFMFGPQGFMHFADLKELPDGDIVIAGFINSVSAAGAVDPNILALRTDGFGSPLWAFTYGSPDNPANEIGYGIDVSPNGDFIAIGAGTDLGVAGSLFSDHLWLDPFGGVIENQVFEGFIPAYAATRVDNDLRTVSAGQDWGVPSPVASPHGPGAMVRYNSLFSVDWFWDYGSIGIASPDRLETVAVDDFRCGYFSAGPKLLPTGLGSFDQFNVKVNDDGVSGCCETRQFPDSRSLPYPQFDMAFTFDFKDEWTRWGQRFDVQLQEQILCLSPRCKPCRVDFNGDGVLDFFDVSIFLTLYAAHDPQADLNCDGLWDFFDVSIFLTEYAAGC